MEEIIDAIKNNCCVVFAGSGLSRSAGIPDWLGLGKQLYKRLDDKGKINEPYKSIIHNAFENDENVPKIIDMLMIDIKRTDITREIREILSPIQESKVHNILKKLKLCGYITTNYDRLINNIMPPNSYLLTNSLSHLKLVPTAVNSSNSFMLKLHGDIDDVLPPDDIEVTKGSAFMVLSNTDYTVLVQGERGEALRLALHAILQKASILFLGYGFADPDIQYNLEFLSRYCLFSNPSWYVCRKGERLPQLPKNVEALQPFNDWNDLPLWLEEIQRKVGKVTVSAAPVKELIISEIDKRALVAIGEYLYGLESDNLSEKILASVLINEITTKEEIQKEWITEFVGKFLDIGPLWADAFTNNIIRHLIKLNIIARPDKDNTFKVIKFQLDSLHTKSSAEFTRERNKFIKSVRKRVKDVGLDFNTDFENKLENTLRYLCMQFAQQMAEWFQRGTGKEIGQRHIHEIVPAFFNDEPNECRKVEELIGIIFDNATNEEVDYIYRHLSAAFLLNSLKLDPSASKFLRDHVSEYELYLDSNILLPLLVSEHENNRWITALIKASEKAGAKIFTLEDIFEEVLGHKEIALQIWANHNGNIESLFSYSMSLGFSTNCFIKGFLSLTKMTSDKKPITWKEYIQQYNESNLRKSIEKIGIKFADVKVVEINDYKRILHAIREEWARKTRGIARADRLNEHEATQFLHIYDRRRNLLYNGKKDEAWFLSYETILEKVYLKNPQRWGKPPTFPVSAWASFLDSRLMFQTTNRKHMLNAILKGNSILYDLPDTTTIVRNKAFGNRILSNIENDALNLVMSGGNLVRKLEETRNAMLKRNYDKDSAAIEFDQITQELVAEIDKELSDNIEKLEQQLSDSKKQSNQEIARLLREVKNLSHKKKKKKRHKKKRK